MATTTTTLNGALTASSTRLTLAAYTAPSGRTKPLLRIDDEIFLITDTTLAPNLGVVRGYMGTAAVAHETLAGAEYGIPNDFPIVAKGPTFQSPSLANPSVFANAQEITATGATGSTAAVIINPAPAYLTITGASGAGVNLGVPSVGEAFTFKNNMTGVASIYSVGATINGTTGTTAFSLTATGNKMAFAYCSTAGAWQIGGNT